jgi:hypothetical protein
MIDVSDKEQAVGRVYEAAPTSPERSRTMPKTMSMLGAVVITAVIAVGVGGWVPWAVAQPAHVPQTGQTNCYAGGALIPCDSTGQDGALQAGVSWPVPRVRDRGDGTVRDNLTGLIWLKNTNCFGALPWDDALAAANNLAHGQCSLTDGSVAGDWRLPNVRELLSLIDYGSESPSLSNTAGTGKLTEGDPFVGVGSGGLYWSSTSAGVSADVASIHAWFVSFQAGGGVGAYLFKSDPSGVWPVRGGQQ